MNDDPQQEQRQSGVPPVVAGKLESLSSDERTFGMLSHLLGIFTGFIGPLVIWLIKKDDSAFVDDQAKESLNFQATILIGQVINCGLMLVCIGYITFLALWVTTLIFCIMATVAANKGERYRYPINIRFIK
ncbi:MAG: DUF4870 domain-containing protein [Planctomycetota bacterium]|nr:DUF4870 domain-containing protein [Planctomycetota bacterium]